ncbi:MAG: hypothetical protein J5J00_16970 [Deltaproteobacteria bacterium]|nr:hypothetical protein [Deltaproteobacteria bacterium]
MKFIFTFTSLFAAVLLPLTNSPTYAENVPFTAAGDNAVKSNLEKLVGKKVILKVANGDELSGTVKEVGTESVVISQLTGKEFYDALVKIDQIAAVIARARDS